MNLNANQSSETPSKALEYISSYSWSKSRLGLERIKQLLSSLGNPESKLKFIHIAGTNGKGSTAAMLSAILQQAGYKTGLYTSPAIHNFNERIQINRESISNTQLEKALEQIRKVADAMSDHPTEFELVTALAIIHFYSSNCDIVIFEVGMGGRLDATNAIETPEIAIITPISIDHTSELGDTVEKIATEKAGIIKQNGTVISHPQQQSVSSILINKCAETNSTLKFVNINSIEKKHSDLSSQIFDYENNLSTIKNLSIPLLGEHQLNNAAVVLTAVDELKSKGWSISENSIREGMKRTYWPGRFEILNQSPLFILDGGHNTQCVQTIFENLSSMFPKKKIIFIIGTLADKSYNNMLEIIAPIANQIFTVTPNNARALNAEALTECAKKINIKATSCQNIKQAVNFSMEAATTNNSIICALGSLYIAGEIRDIFRN